MHSQDLRQEPARIPRETTWRPAPALGAVVVHFSLFGILSGVKGVIWAELLTSLQLSAGQLGSAQLVTPLISTLLLLRYAPLARWAGPKLLTISGLGLAAVALVLMGSVGTLPSLVVSLALLGAGAGALDGAMNQTAIDWERATRKPVMNFIHACFSSGAVLGSLSAGFGLGSGWSYGQVLVALALVYGVSAGVTLLVRYPPAEALDTATKTGAWQSLLRDPVLRSLIVIGGLSIVVESSVFLWSVIYLRNDLRAPVVLGSAAFAAFNGAMFFGRMINGPIVAWSGPRTSLLLSGAGLVVGAALLVTAQHVGVAFAALTLLGLAVAGIFPTVVAAAGAALPGKSGELTAALMTVIYVCFMLAPPVIGWIAELTSLRSALALIGLCGCGVLGFAMRLPGRHPAASAPSEAPERLPS